MRLTTLILVAVFLSILAASAFIAPRARMSALPEGANSPVVVELFTSEGCSSCPPADALLARLENGQGAGKLQVIALEEHVDYWDDLGWKDPFSSSDWTARQYAYAGALGNGNAYTPQMVVDGQVEFVGSRSQQARESILLAAGRAKTAVTLTRGEAKGNKQIFDVTVGKIDGVSRGDSAEVWLAVTETGLHSTVTRGENAGEELRHAAVVRTMRKVGEAKVGGETSFTGSPSIPLANEWKRENLKAVLFVQERKSRRILAATELRIAQ